MDLDKLIQRHEEELSHCEGNICKTFSKELEEDTLEYLRNLKTKQEEKKKE